jgi:hypothetical protein
MDVVRMKYKNLGIPGVKVSRLCLGCMSFGVPERGDHPVDLARESEPPADPQAIELGINFSIPPTPIPTVPPRKSSARRSRILRAATKS